MPPEPTTPLAAGVASHAHGAGIGVHQASQLDRALGVCSAGAGQCSGQCDEGTFHVEESFIVGEWKRVASAVTGADDEPIARAGLRGKPGTVAFSHQGRAGVGTSLRPACKAVLTG